MEPKHQIFFFQHLNYFEIFQAMGIQIVRAALAAPCRTIAANAGVEPSVVVSKVADLTGDMGYDAALGEYVNMVERGIIDPTKVRYPLHVTWFCLFILWDFYSFLISNLCYS